MPSGIIVLSRHTSTPQKLTSTRTPRHVLQSSEREFGVVWKPRRCANTSPSFPLILLLLPFLFPSFPLLCPSRITVHSHRNHCSQVILAKGEAAMGFGGARGVVEGCGVCLGLKGVRIKRERGLEFAVARWNSGGAVRLPWMVVGRRYGGVGWWFWWMGGSRVLGDV